MHVENVMKLFTVFIDDSVDENISQSVSALGSASRAMVA